MVAACLLFGDYKKGGFENDGVHDSANQVELPEKANLLWAFAPLLPVILLFVVAIGFPQVKVSVGDSYADRRDLHDDRDARQSGGSDKAVL